MSDHRIIADGLFPGGMDPKKLTEIGRSEVRAAVEALLRIVDRDNARLALALEQLDKGAAEIERLRALDREAAEYVESVICMRTDFTGDPPYVGWKGLGLALTQALDERDRLRAALQEMEGGE